MGDFLSASLSVNICSRAFNRLRFQFVFVYIVQVSSTATVLMIRKKIHRFLTRDKRFQRLVAQKHFNEHKLNRSCEMKKIAIKKDRFLEDPTYAETLEISVPNRPRKRSERYETELCTSANRTILDLDSLDRARGASETNGTARDEGSTIEIVGRSQKFSRMGDETGKFYLRSMQRLVFLFLAIRRWAALFLGFAQQLPLPPPSPIG